MPSASRQLSEQRGSLTAISDGTELVRAIVGGISRNGGNSPTLIERVFNQIGWYPLFSLARSEVP